MGILYSCGELMNTRNIKRCQTTFTYECCGISGAEYCFTN